MIQSNEFNLTLGSIKVNHDPIDLALLKSFLAVAKSKSFLLGAESVGRSPSALSMQIKRLEEVIGHDLFVRNARETRLTKEGERLVDPAKNLLARELEMRHAFDLNPLVGEVLLGVPDDVIERFPMEVLREFTDQYPQVKVSIRVDHTPSLLRSVERNEIDLAIVTIVDTIAGIEKAEMIYQEPEVWAAKKGGVAAATDPLPVTLWDPGWGWFDRTVSGLKKAQVNYQITLQTENITARKNAIKADLCVGPLPVSQLDDDMVSVPSLLTLAPLPTYALGLVEKEEAELPIKALGDYLRNFVNFQTSFS